MQSPSLRTQPSQSTINVPAEALGPFPSLAHLRRAQNVRAGWQLKVWLSLNLFDTSQTNYQADYLGVRIDRLSKRRSTLRNAM
jgi:hypothetical protein